MGGIVDFVIVCRGRACPAQQQGAASGAPTGIALTVLAANGRLSLSRPIYSAT